VHVDDKLSHLYDLASAFGGDRPGDLMEIEEDPQTARLTSSLSFVGVHYTRVASDRDGAREHDIKTSPPMLDAGTIALAHALTSAEARLHLHNAVQCASGDKRFYDAKH
jgi:hypothetical protein